MLSLKIYSPLTAGAILLAIGLSPAYAQKSAATTTPSNIGWSSSDTRAQLMSKASTYFSTTQGDFVNKNAMMVAAPPAPASRVVMEAKANNLSEQFNYVLGGIPDPEVTLAGGQKLFGACEPHNCVGNKAFVVTDASGGAVQAAGFLGPKCGASRKADPGQQLALGCDAIPTLTIFYTDKQARKPGLSLDIIKWARQKVIADGRFKSVKIEERFVR